MDSDGSQVFDVRTLDPAGRLVIPEAVRALLGWRFGDRISITVEPDGRVVLVRRTGEPESSSPEDQTAN
jgi:AbrB family looped-hinge helix DNA binding protein